MLTKQVVLILFCSFFTESVLAGYFTLVGPRTVQYGHDYKFALVATDGGNLTDIEVKVEVSTGNTIFKENYILIDDVTKEITVEMTDQTQLQNYTLTATSKKFSQSVAITTISKKCTVLIQTDKAVYKPGDTIQYRILVLDSHTKPYDYTYLMITITDANGKVLLSDVPLKNDNEPVVEQKFAIGDSTSFGKWKIEVVIDEDPNLTVKAFEVRKYVQPRLQVFADTKPFLPISQRDVVVKLYAKYNSGESVKGKAKVAVKSYDPKTFEVLKQNEYNFGNVFNQQILILNMTKDLNVYMITLRDIKVNISVEFVEDLTNQKYFVDKTVTIHQEARFEIEVFRPQPKLKPGFPYKFTAIVRQPDGSLEDYAGTVKVKAEYYYGEKCEGESNDKAIERFDLYTLATLKNGKADFSIDVPQNTTDIALTVSYYHNEEEITIEGSPSKTSVYLNANMKKASKFEVGETVSLEIKSHSLIGTVHYAIIGRTGELISKTEKPESKEFEIQFETEAWMIPEVQVLVYYIHSTGEVIYDVVTLKSDENLPNYLTINLSRNSTQPNHSIDFNLQSTPKSTVYLLAVDRSAKLLRTGNDIDEETVLNDYKAYDMYRKEKLKLRGSFSSDQRYIVVGESNTFIITDAYKGLEQSCGGKRSKRSLDFIDTSDNFKSAVRENFPETWIFEKVEVNENGHAILQQTVPAAITTWDISGFAISQEFGFGIAKPQTLRVSQDFFLNVNLPYSAKVGEVFKVDASVFNFYDELGQKTDVDVTLFSEGNFDFFSSPKSAQLRDSSHLKTQRVTVEKGFGASTSFFIKASKAGEVNIKVRAEVSKNKRIFDEVHFALKVEA